MKRERKRKGLEADMEKENQPAAFLRPAPLQERAQILTGGVACEKAKRKAAIHFGFLANP